MLLSDLKTGCCKETVVTRLLRFWEARTVKKGGGAYGCGHGGLYISSLFSDVRYWFVNFRVYMKILVAHSFVLMMIVMR